VNPVSNKDVYITILSSSKTLLILSLTVVSIPVVDGILTSLPFYHLETQRSSSIAFLFVTEIVVSSVCQILLLRILDYKFRKGIYATNFLKYAKAIHFIVSITQSIVIALLIITSLELVIFKEYNSQLLIVITILSISLSVGLLSLLTIRFVQWSRHRPDYLTISYTIAMALMTTCLFLLCIFMILEMKSAPTIVNYARMPVAISQVSHFEIYDVQSIFTLISYIAFWFASILLLSNKTRNYRRIRFFPLVMIPLLYYIGFFQWTMSSIIAEFDILNSLQTYTFNILSSILTRPIGGTILGVAFLIVAKRISDENLKSYMRFSALGIILLSISTEDSRIYLLPYPPFGVVTISFMSISSYLLIIGIYYSAVLTSMNDRIRTMIDRSVDMELRFLSNIGRSQMEKQIRDRVKMLTERFAVDLVVDSGIDINLDSEEIEKQVSIAIEEREAMLEKEKGFQE
jgi:hypothetical protein